VRPGPNLDQGNLVITQVPDHSSRLTAGRTSAPRRVRRLGFEAALVLLPADSHTSSLRQITSACAPI